MQHSVRYTLLFAAAICVVCAIMVSSSAVTLKERQEVNQALSKKRNVLEAAGLVEVGEKLTQEQILERFSSVESVLVDMRTGDEVEGDTENFDQQKRKKDPNTSFALEPNLARVSRMPEQAVVYKVRGDGGAVEKLVLPIEGYGLWGHLFGFIAVGADTSTVEGITYYEHKETPGLGGEVDNPSWKALWPGRQVFDDQGEVALEVIKGAAGKPAEDPYRVDGMSGATITGRGVTNMLDLWLGPEGFGPFLENFRAGRSAA